MARREILEQDPPRLDMRPLHLKLPFTGPPGHNESDNSSNVNWGHTWDKRKCLNCLHSRIGSIIVPIEKWSYCTNSNSCVCRTARDKFCHLLTCPKFLHSVQLKTWQFKIYRTVQNMSKTMHGRGGK